MAVETLLSILPSFPKSPQRRFDGLQVCPQIPNEYREQCQRNRGRKEHPYVIRISNLISTILLNITDEIGGIKTL
jgi:hypothetical protein